MNKQVAKTNETEQSLAIIGSLGIPGLEEMDTEDIVIPRAKLLQGSSEYIKNPEQYPDLRVGMIINTVTKEPLVAVDDSGKKAYPFIPVKMYKSWIKFNAQKQDDPLFDRRYKPGAVIHNTYDKNDPLANGEDAWMYRQTNFLGFQPGTRQPMVISFGKTSAKTGKDIINYVSLAGRALYEHLFYIGSKTEKTDENTYMVLTARSIGKPTEADVKTAIQMYQEFNPILSNMKTMGTKIKIHDEEEIIEAEVTPAPKAAATTWDD